MATCRSAATPAWSVPQLAAELGATQWTVKQALARAGVKLPPRPQRLARQRSHATEQRLAARAAGLGFEDIRAYLADRLLARGWLLVDVTAELGAHRVTVRRLMDRHSVQRTRRTQRELAAGERGRRAQSVSRQARRACPAGRAGLPGPGRYLQRRFVEQGWSIKRLRAELWVGRRWLVAELARLGIGC